jgi:hypothetical protein
LSRAGYDPYYPNSNGLYIVMFLQEISAFHPNLTEIFDVGDAWLGEVGGE